jgi:PTH1 family peptidyl-tRNA hydrolase
MALFGRAKRPERRGTPYDALVVGLGNPGKQYDGSRHNVGFDAIAGLAAQCSTTLKTGRDRALVAETRIDSKRIVLATPTTFMNESGNAVSPLARRYGIDEPSQLIVVHDELDLDPGVVRVKIGGGLAGHNGLRSIAHHLKNQDFVRVRIGVGKPPSKEQGADHVLSRLSAADRRVLDDAVAVAVEAVTLIVQHGAEHAMQRINGR